jgi:hypothetical protein
MTAKLQTVLVFFLAVVFFPREARVSGSAVGTITETHFEISGDDGLRKHFADSADEYEYHKRERAKIAKALRPLADKIKALVDRLMKKKPWSDLIQTYDHSADPGPDVNLKQFESPEFGPYIQKLQDKGPYRYVTGFMHYPGDTLPLRTTVRFMFLGKIEPEALYELEDGLHTLRDTAPKDSRYTANPEGVKLHADSCDEYKKKLEKIRTGFTELLKKQGLLYKGHEHEGSLFEARLEGKDLCLANFELMLAGEHHWGRARKAFIQATQAVFKHAIEWPGYPPDPHANLAPWRIVVDPGN